MKNVKQIPIYNFILSALFSALTVICAWITIPTAVPFTMQTFAIFLTAQLLPLKYSLLSMAVYIGLGAVGLPVFSGFQGGAGVLFGPTGGYIIGFIFIILTTGLAETFFNDGKLSRFFSMTTGLILCYIFGTLWFMFVSKTDILSALLICVVPYIVFDIAKMILSFILYKKLKRQIENA